MPKKEKLGLETKIEFIRQCISGGLGVSEASRMAGVHLKTMQEWIGRYEVEGIAGFLPQERSRVYRPEVKERAVQDSS